MPLVSFAVDNCVVQTPNIVHGFSLRLQSAIHEQETAQTFAGLLKYISLTDLSEDSCLGRNEAEISISRFVSRINICVLKAIKNTFLEQTMPYNTKR